MKNPVKVFFSINPVSLTLYATLIVVLLFWIGVPLLDLIELKTYDIRFLSRGHLKPTPEVVLAVIDEKSLDKEGRWPWPRTKIAKLVDTLSEDGAKVIGFDIFFSEPDENSQLKLIGDLDQEIKKLGIKNNKLDLFINESKKAADNDLVLAKAIKRSRASVVLGYFFHMSEAEDFRIPQEEIERQLDLIAPSKYPVISYENQDVGVSHFIGAHAPEGNLELFTNATPYSGYINMLGDEEDGILRWMPMITKCGENIFPPLPVLCAWHYLEQPQLMVKVAGFGVEGIQMGEDRFIPTDESGKMLINYLGPERTYPHYSVTDILSGKVPKGTFTDKIVLLGVTAIGIYDVRNMPFSTTSTYPGLEAHATVVDNILNGHFLDKPKWALIYDMLTIIFLGVLIGVVLPRLSALKGISFFSGLFIVHLFVSRWLFVDFGIWINIVYPLLALALVYTCLTVYRYFTEERQKKQIKGAFSFYVSSSVVNEMIQHPERLKLGGDKKDLTVLFSDIRGFTTISEGMTPEELVHLLNEYLTVMTDVVFKYDGTLDKYIGDAVMAIFGAPVERENHPANACHAALEMMDELKKLNEKWLKEGKKPLNIGIGINTGMMMVGNMGSEQRFDYTVMGDAVNLGSRLEGANKSYKTNILLSESTYDRVKDAFFCMELDSVRVKGKTEPVKIYQLLAHQKIAEERARAISFFQRALQHYKAQHWDEAIKTFQLVLDIDREIYPAQIYILRCRNLKSNPPPPHWDGVFTMTTK